MKKRDEVHRMADANKAFSLIVFNRHSYNCFILIYRHRHYLLSVLDR